MSSPVHPGLDSAQQGAGGAMGLASCPFLSGKIDEARGVDKRPRKKKTVCSPFWVYSLLLLECMSILLVETSAITLLFLTVYWAK